jgi:hypothetical protein
LLLLAGVAPVDVEVACDGAVHVARFADGRLQLVDHDEDAERALVALGGELPPCLALADAWATAAAAVDSGGLHPLDGLAQLGKEPAGERPDPWVPPADRAAPAGRRASNPRRVLPLALDDVLAQATVLACEARWGDPAFAGDGRRTAHRFLSERLEQAFRTTLGAIPVPRPTVRLALACRAVGAGDEVSIDVDVSRGQVRIEVVLRVGWLVRVWRAGVAAVGDLVVLDVVDTDEEGGLVVQGVQWERRERDLVPRPRLARLEGRGTDVVIAGDPVPAPLLDPWWSLRVGR